MMLVKEEFVGGEKYMRAMKLGGSDAIAMWFALKCYAAMHPQSAGFIPDEDVDGLRGAPKKPRKALEALVACGRLLPGGERGAGLVDPVEGGWQLHDYLDHSAPPEEIELKRERERLRKQDYRAHKRRELEAVRRFAAGERALLTAGDSPGDSAGHVPWDNGDTPRYTGGDIDGDNQGTSLAGACPPAPARAHEPNPPLSNPTKNSSTPNAQLRDRAPASARRPDPRRKPRGSAAAEHERFATEHALNLDEIVADCSAQVGFRDLKPEDQQRAVSKALLDAAAVRESIGGAA